MHKPFQLSPFFLYGTAWKEEETARLVFEALTAGFRGIDTANQRRHYHEEGVGQGIRRFLDSSSMKREELFIQTKYTFARGQDHRLPYDEKAPIATQVLQSFERSLHHLQTSYIDSLVLHGPTSGRGILPADWEAWRAMERLAEEGKVRMLGISNCAYDQLVQIYEQANVKPAFLQNRCYAALHWDKENRAFCKQHGIIYQGFSLLTANTDLIMGKPIQEIARKYSKTVPQIIFRFSMDVGMLPLTGTTQKKHMIEDLGISDFELTAEELHAIEHIGH